MKEIKDRVLKDGKSLDPKLYTWDHVTRTFSSIENGITLDFEDMNGITFNTYYNCTFKTDNNCVFYTARGSNFNTGDNCNFNTEDKCTFKVGIGCVIINRNHNNKIIITQPIPNQKLIIGIDYNVYYDNPIVDIKYKKGLNKK